MKKILLTWLLITSSLANAQTILLEQNFENPSELGPQGWGRIDFDGDGTFFNYTPTQPALVAMGFTGGAMFSMSFFHDDENNPVVIENSDNVLVSPMRAIPNEGPAELSFRMGGVGYGDSGTNITHYAVYVITENQLNSVPDQAAFKILLDGETPVAEDILDEVASQVYTIDLTPYAGEDIVVLFRQFDTDFPAYVMVDDIRISAGVMSIADKNITTFDVYPNPATDSILLSGQANIDEIIITDINGRIVQQLKQNGLQKVSVNIAMLEAGIYVVRAYTDAGIFEEKIIKE